MEKCKIFLFGVGGPDAMNQHSEEVNRFLSDGKKIITRVLQSSAVWSGDRGNACIGTHLTIFYKEK